MSEQTFNLQILRGLSTNNSLLSSIENSIETKLNREVDHSGRQEWVIKRGSAPQQVTIQVKGPPKPGLDTLTAKPDGSGVYLTEKNDKLGLIQEWKRVYVDDPSICGTYNLIVAGGVSNDASFLGTNEKGDEISLFSKDDGKGRQRWQIQKNWRA